MSYVYDSELQHHGILGQRWGVRRYQNYDGSYTQAGLARYQKAKSSYESAKTKLTSTRDSYKKGNASKERYKQAKAEVKSTKKKMDSEYDQLSQHKKADEGKELYIQGKRITTNTNTTYIREAAVIAGTGIASGILSEIGDQTTAAIGSGVLAIGGTAVNVILARQASSTNAKLRAYYGERLNS